LAWPSFIRLRRGTTHGCDVLVTQFGGVPVWPAGHVAGVAAELHDLKREFATAVAQLGV
jgi:hypothetical protein